MMLTPEIVLQAYRSGIFPMAEHRDDPELFWVDPRRRGVIPLDAFHISRSLARRLRQSDYQITLNQDFRGVIDGCADRNETWINAELLNIYETLFTLGAAQSLEVWMDEQLVGGVYGISIGRAFCGESMFSRRRDASKIALAWLVDQMNRTGFTLFDTQFLTTHLASLGGQEITRAAYRQRLAEALEADACLTSAPLAASGYEVVQRNTQTS